MISFIKIKIFSTRVNCNFCVLINYYKTVSERVEISTTTMNIFSTMENGAFISNISYYKTA